MPVEMWKRRFIVITKENVFQMGRGNLFVIDEATVEKKVRAEVFLFSTTPFSTGPVEMWKTQ